MSCGILSYSLTAFIVPMSAELGWSKPEITSAFSLAQLFAGVAALPSIALARAIAPVGASLVYSAAGGGRHGYDVVLVVLLLLCLGAAVSVLLAAMPMQRRPQVARS